MKNKKNKRDLFVLKIITAAMAAVAIIVLLVVGIKTDFDKDKFFTPKNDENTTLDDSISVPYSKEIKNLLFISTNDDEENVQAVVLLQANFKDLSYTACALPPATVYDGKTLNDYYLQSGAQGLRRALSSLTTLEIDRFVCMDDTAVKKAIERLGSVIFAISEDINYVKSGENPLTLRLKAGEQSLNGEQIVKLFRYSGEIEGSLLLQNELTIAVANQIFNEKNLENAEKSFEYIYNLVETDITISDFSKAYDNIAALSKGDIVMKNSTAVLEYKNTDKGIELSEKMLGEIKQKMAK